MVAVSGVKGTATKSHFLSDVGGRNTSSVVGEACSTSSVPSCLCFRTIKNRAAATISPSSTATQTVAIIPFVVDLSNELPPDARGSFEEGAIVVEGEVDEEMAGGDEDSDVNDVDDNEGDDRTEEGDIDELIVVEGC